MRTQCLNRMNRELLLLWAVLAACAPAYGIPAFARKYGLRCSACHEGWPKLNNFGQVFKTTGTLPSGSSRVISPSPFGSPRSGSRKMRKDWPVNRHNRPRSEITAEGHVQTDT